MKIRPRLTRQIRMVSFKAVVLPGLAVDRVSVCQGSPGRRAPALSFQIQCE